MSAWRATYTVVAPVAKTVTVTFPEKPEDRELVAEGDRLGTWTAVRVAPAARAA